MSGFCIRRWRRNFRRYFAGLIVVIGHKPGRGDGFDAVIGLNFNFEIRRLFCADFRGTDFCGNDFRDFRLRLQRLAVGLDGSSQRIQYSGIVGQGFELLDASASLVGHEVLEIETDLFDRLSNFGIAGSVCLITGRKCSSGNVLSRGRLLPPDAKPEEGSEGRWGWSEGP